MSKEITISESSMREVIERFSNSQKAIAESFQKIQNQMQSISGDRSWEGLASDAFLNKFKLLEQNFPKINQKYLSYITFMETVLEKYGNEDNSLQRKIDNIDISLDISKDNA